MSNESLQPLTDEENALGLFMAFNVAYLDGVMKGEHPEIRSKWDTVRAHLVKLAIAAYKSTAAPSEIATKQYGPSRDELKKLFPLLWHINDHLSITPDQAVAYSGSTNDVDRLRDALHKLDPNMDLGTDHEGLTYEDWQFIQGGIGAARDGTDI